MKAQLLRFLLVNLLALGLAHQVNAQGPTVASEHRYFFRCPAEISTAAEKRLIEALRGLDPELVIANRLSQTERFTLTSPVLPGAADLRFAPPK